MVTGMQMGGGNMSGGTSSGNPGNSGPSGVGGVNSRPESGETMRGVL